MRIGIYSGTFDPIHEGHILFAQVCAEQFGLDKVLILPEPKPRYKDVVTDIDHREAMCTLALNSSDADIALHTVPNEASHTIRGVIENIHAAYPDDEYLLMMGSDVFATVPSWGSRDDEDGTITDIAQSVGMIVGISSMSHLPAMKKIAEENNLKVRFIEVPAAKLSSRDIRQSIKEGKPPGGLNDNVVRYIEHEKLYT